VLWWALTTGALGAVPLPPPVETGYLLGKGLPLGAPPVPLTDELYVLGWSAQGSLALLQRETGVTGPPVVRLRVLDTVEDTVLWEKVWPDWGSADNRDAWWTARGPEVEAVFHQFTLQSTDWQLGQFPLIQDNDFYSLALRLRWTSDPAWIDRWDLVVHSSDRGLKVVAHGEGVWRWATFVGFVPSPWDDRVAAILLVQPEGWAGSRQPLRFVVVGVSLKYGFPKP